MKLKYYGTAAAEGWPGIFCRCSCCIAAKTAGGKNIRTRSQALVDDNILIDLPPDTYLHMIRDGLDMPGIRHVLITHTHQDHFYPEELLFRCGGFAHGVNEPLMLYGSDAMVRRLEKYAAEHPGNEGHLSDRIAWRELKPYEAVDIDGYSVTAMLANHDRNECCYIYLIQRQGESLLYGNDTGFFPEATWDHLSGKKLKLVSLDCTMGKFAEGSNHMGLPDVLRVKEKLKEIRCADENTGFIATHFSHNGQLLHDELVQAFHPSGMTVAYDGMQIEV